MNKDVSDTQLLSWGIEAIAAESEALKIAASKLDLSFVATVRHILSLQGKVILTGLGKSGHIARKVAATLASTGTSAFFLHPTEALHGDFGSISRYDMVLAIAFGGETREVVEVLKYAKRLQIKSAGICGVSSSSLAKLVDFYLDGSVAKEACPLNLAPTSSTTVAMAIGDGLAVALMRAKGFNMMDFAVYHPDGSLGRKLALVADHMRRDEEVAKCAISSDFYDILSKVTRNNFGIVAVVDDRDTLLGAITDGDLRRAIIKHNAQVFTLKAVDIMTRTPKTIGSESLVVDAFCTMEQNKITAIFVVDAQQKDRLVGILRMHDLLAAKII